MARGKMEAPHEPREKHSHISKALADQQGTRRSARHSQNSKALADQTGTRNTARHSQNSKALEGQLVGLMTIMMMMMMMIMGMLMRMLVMTMEMLIYHVLKGDVEGLVILLVGDGPFFSRGH